MTCPGIDGGNRCVVVGSGMTESDTMSRADERAYEIDPTWQFRRHRHDPDVWTERRDHIEDVARRIDAVRRVLPRASQTVRWLRSLVIGVDEIALEVRG